MPAQWLTQSDLLSFLPFTCEIVVAVMLFVRGPVRWPRLCAGAAVMTGVALAVGALRCLESLPVDDGMTLAMAAAPVMLPLQSLYYAVIAAALVALARVLLELGWIEALITVTAGYATQHLAFALTFLVLLASGDSRYVYDARLFPLRALCYALVYVVVWLATARRFTIDGGKIRMVPLRTAVSMALMLTVIVFNMSVQFLTHTRTVDTDTQTLFYMYDALCSLLSLALLLSVTALDRTVSDLEIIRKMDQLNERHYEMSRESIELINTKFHDIRKNLSSLRRTARELRADEVGAGADAGPLDSLPHEAIRRMEDAIHVYDSIYHTGDPALDALLTERGLYCNAHGITLTAIVDGTATGFIDRSDVYALFGNILDNAIEAVLLLAPDERQVDLMVRRDAGLLRIEEQNYFTGPLDIVDGLPASTKGDRRFHGFGVKSIRRQVERYRGDMAIDTADGIFSLSIMLPIPESHS